MTELALDPPGEKTAELPNGITLAYDTFGDPGDPPLLLIQGLGMQMIGWPEEFCEELAAKGVYVVRFDNRDVGHSTHLESVHPPGLRQLFTRRFGPDQYSLADMADDAALLLDDLDLSPAHVVGISLGGMIAQTMAARHPEKVRSLTSMMSTTGHRMKGQPALGLYRVLLKRAPTERDAFVEHMTGVFERIGSTGLPRDTEEVRELAGRSYDRGTDPAGSGRQLAAVLRSGNRTHEIRGISAPTLVFHGTQDKLVRPSGGKATAKAIPGARLETIKGMGHDLPRAAWPRIVSAIVAHARSADKAAGRQVAERTA